MMAAFDHMPSVGVHPHEHLQGCLQHVIKACRPPYICLQLSALGLAGPALGAGLCALHLRIVILSHALQASTFVLSGHF